MDWTSLHAYIGQKGADIAWWQMTVRGVLVFLFGLAVLRIAGRRVFNKGAPIDIILAVLIGSNLSRALTGNAPFAATLAATAGLVLVYWVIMRIAFHFKPIGWLVKGRPTRLVQDGKIDWQVMRRHGFSEGDLAEALRSKGIAQVQEVMTAYMERDGSISVVRKQ